MNKGKLHIRLYICFFVLFIRFHSFDLKAQIPGTCFEIESILVDGCDGSNEVKNEMVRFVIGNSPLNTANLTVAWPNTSNPWFGICQNATTTAAVAQINATILRCGYLKEPVSGVLPAGAKVILVTSTAFNPLAQSFANLSDTLYIIFQCAGTSTGGHFKNYATTPPPLTRTLTMSFSSPPGCSDVVTYNISSLTTPAGTTGGADGGTVEFAWNGTPSYVNFGCQGPFIPLTVNAGPGSTICGGPVSLTGTVSGTSYGVIWQGGVGTFSNPTTLSTIYTPAASETGTIILSFGAIGACQDTIFDTLTIQLTTPPPPSTSPLSYCMGATPSVLNATGSNLLWYTIAAGGTGAATAPTPSTAAAGTTNYYVSQTIGGCESARTILPVTINSLPNVNAGTDNVLGCGVNSLVLNGSTSTLNTSYSWTGPGIVSGNTSLTPTVNAAGTYTLTVTDLNLCYSNDAVIITQLGILTSSTSVTAISCFGANNGIATANIIVGTGPFTYSWAPGGQTTQTISGLALGTYTVTITGANNCTTSGTAVITQPALLSASTTVSPVSCFGGNNGSSVVTSTGGIAPHTYSWSPSGGIAANATTLSAGTYTVTVTDSNNCTATATSIITQPAALLSISTTTIQATCGINNGSASTITTGGTGSYTYLWTPSGGTAANASSLGAGTYTVTVTDLNSCTATATTIISPNTAVTTTISSTPVLCFGGITGSASSTTTGGTAPYTHLWTPSGGTGANATALSAGAYSVTVVDVNGCSATANTVVTQPSAPLSAPISSTQVTCFGLNNGSASVSVTGGTSPYTYSWSPSGGIAANATALPAGTYTVTVTDINNCTATATTIITQPVAALTITTTTIQATCGINNGSASTSTTGGTAPYTYLWTPSGGTSANATSLGAGTYTVTVKDLNNCTATSTSTISPNSAVTTTISSAPVLCFGGFTGSASVFPEGGSAPYTYAWSPSGGTAAIATGLSAGSYSVTVTDLSGCTAIANTIVAQPGSALTASIIPTTVSCFGGNNGSAMVNPTGGTSPYTYLWSPSGGTSSNAVNLSAGNYSVTITDANSCTTNAAISIAQPSAPTASSIIPVDVNCFGEATGSATAIPTCGTPPYSYSWMPFGGNSVVANGLTAGTYTVTISDNNGCSIPSSSTTISQPTAALTASVATTPTNCTINNGVANALPTGGTAPYSFSWSPGGAVTSTISGLAQGTYSLTISDNQGCIYNTSAFINTIGAITASISSTPIRCPGDANGTLTASTFGGTAPYSYTWSTSQTGAGIVNLDSGEYFVIATDAFGCSDADSIMLLDPPKDTISFSSNPEITDIYNPEIQFLGSASNGYLWQWEFGDLSTSTIQNPVHTYTNEGTYSVLLIVVNPNGCIDSVMHDIIIEDGFTFFAPNAFTPNDDTKNDLFLPEGKGWDSKKYLFSVFDRWGNLCFLTTDIKEGWNGKSNQGKEVSQIDVYVWKVQLFDIFGKKHNFVGSVTIAK